MVFGVGKKSGPLGNPLLPDHIAYRQVQKPALLQAGSEGRQAANLLLLLHAFIFWYLPDILKDMLSLLGYQGGNTGRGEEGVRGILAIETRAWLPGPKNSEKPVESRNGSAPDLPSHPCTSTLPLRQKNLCKPS